VLKPNGHSRIDSLNDCRVQVTEGVGRAKPGPAEPPSDDHCPGVEGIVRKLLPREKRWRCPSGAILAVELRSRQSGRGPVEDPYCALNVIEARDGFAPRSLYGGFVLSEELLSARFEIGWRPVYDGTASGGRGTGEKSN